MFEETSFVARASSPCWRFKNSKKKHCQTRSFFPTGAIDTGWKPLPRLRFDEGTKKTFIWRQWFAFCWEFTRLPREVSSIAAFSISVC
jgi:hypothetical protein